MKLNNITSNGRWCAYCSHQSLCGNIDCELCFANSFASCEKSKYWDYTQNNDIVPINVFRRSANKYNFICNFCNKVYNASLSNISVGYWCYCTKNKTEAKLYENLLPLYPRLITQFKQDWCKNITYLPFDFCIPEYKIIIELDGPQHFKQVSNWSTPEEQFDNDKYKEKCANDNDYSVIRILQTDVLNDIYDWKKELCKTIEELINGDEITNVYLCKNGEYVSF